MVFLLLFIFFSGFLWKIICKKNKATNSHYTTFSDNETKKGIIIGNTKQVIFLLEGKKVKAIPFTATVKEFEIRN